MSRFSDFFRRTSIYLTPQIYVNIINYDGVLCTSRLDYDDSFEDIVEEDGVGLWY